MDLAAIPWRATRYPGVAVHFYARDERTRRVVAAIRMDAGCGYPRHRHTGEEHVLVLQGAYRDQYGEHRAGEFARYAAGTEHAPIAGDGPCVLLAVAEEGVALL